MGTVNPNDSPEQQRADIGPGATTTPEDVADFSEAQQVQHLVQSPPETPNGPGYDQVVKVSETDPHPEPKGSVELKDEPTPNVLGPEAVTNVAEPDERANVAEPLKDAPKDKGKGK